MDARIIVALGLPVLFKLGSDLKTKHDNKKKLNKSLERLNDIMSRLDQDLYVQRVMQEGRRVSKTDLEFEAYCAMQGVKLLNS